MNVYAQAALEHVFTVVPSTTILIVATPLLVSDAVTVSVTEVLVASWDDEGLLTRETAGPLLSEESVVLKTDERAFALSSRKQ